jgi:hypothetical protein
MRVTRTRLIKAGYSPGFELDEALEKFQPDEMMSDEEIVEWVKYNRPKSQTKRRNQ